MPTPPEAPSLEQTLRRLRDAGLSAELGHIRRGLEKESLRIDQHGVLAQTPHPRALGSALTHPSITTDYSEALLEFITPVCHDTDTLLATLDQIHHFTYHHLADEKLWVNSMPCVVQGQHAIPQARYGHSNIAQMKQAYRRGLSYRYGSLMQTIAGIHYNFSLPDQFWHAWLTPTTAAPLQHQISAHYFNLIRNFHRHAWLLCYLFGASPAVCKTFLHEQQHSLEAMDSHSFYAPHATSLRLSELGYSNNAQAGIHIDYNHLDDFVTSLRRAVQTPHPPYQRYGVKVDGVYRQLNANLLQIENEFYAVIRPKRITESGESPAAALKQRGVEYVEVRSLDLNPFDPLGIDASCLHFMDTFLLSCLFIPSPPLSPAENQLASENRQRVVMHGRQPGLTLRSHGREQAFTSLATQLLEQMQPVAELLDQVNATSAYSHSHAAQQRKVADADTTPSARILEQMQQQHLSFFEFALDAAEQHEQHFKQRPLPPDTLRQFQTQATTSLHQQQQLEHQDRVNFDDFLQEYFQRQH